MSDDIERLKAIVAAHAADFSGWLFPEGKRSGGYYLVGGLSGARGRSLGIQLRGAFAGHFHDWATGEHGDCISATMAARNVDFPTAKRLLMERYGVTLSASPPPKSVEPRESRLLRLPALELGSEADRRALATSRNLSDDAIQLAVDRGNLRFHNSREGRAWLITDRARRNAQSRLLDGQPWAWNGKKSWTLGGSQAAWPIGLPESEPFAGIALCEGAPDFISAFHHALVSGVEKEVAAVCMTGASLTIPAECLPAFRGKHVRIFVHDDDAGRAAAIRWAAQFRPVAARVDGFTFDGLLRRDGAPVKDLCDLASIAVESWETHRSEIESALQLCPA